MIHLETKVATNEILKKECGTASGEDERTLNFLKKYRHIILQTSGEGVIGFSVNTLQMQEVLMNQQILSMMTRLRANCTPRLSDETSKYKKVTISLSVGRVTNSHFNTDQVTFGGNDQEEVVVEENLLSPLTITLYIYKSSNTIQSNDVNRQVLSSFESDISDIVIVDSIHTIFSSIIILETEYTIKVNRPYHVEEALLLAKDQILSEIDNISKL